MLEDLILLRHILERVGLEEYMGNFVLKGYDRTDTFSFITEKDLDVLEITKRGHRKGILFSIDQYHRELGMLVG